MHCFEIYLSLFDKWRRQHRKQRNPFNLIRSFVLLAHKKENLIWIWGSVFSTPNKFYTDFYLKMSMSRRNCLNLTKELNQYLAKKDSEIRKKLKEGPPSLDNLIPPSSPPKSLVNYFAKATWMFDCVLIQLFCVFCSSQLPSTEVSDHRKFDFEHSRDDACVLVTTNNWPCIRYHRSHNSKPIPIEYYNESKNLLLKIFNKIHTNPFNCFQREFYFNVFVFLQCCCCWWCYFFGFHYKIKQTIHTHNDMRI